MMDALLIAGKRLADALRAENEALSKLDLSRAAKLAESKIAATDAFTQLTDAVGSGPFRFVRGEWVPGSRAVYERNAA
jgi:ABC-type transport system substrate-binding protein